MNTQNSEKFGIKVKFLDSELWLLNDKQEILSFDCHKEAEAKLKNFYNIDAVSNKNVFVAKIPKEVLEK